MKVAHAVGVPRLEGESLAILVGCSLIPSDGRWKRGEGDWDMVWGWVRMRGWERGREREREGVGEIEKERGKKDREGEREYPKATDAAAR